MKVLRGRSYLVAKMKKLKRELFAKAVVEVSILEKKLLTKTQLERILRAENFQQVQSLLLAAGYRHFPTHGVEQLRIHTLLNAYLADFLEELLAISPPDSSEYLDMLLLDFDLHNIQVALAQRQGGSAVANHIIAVPQSRHAYYAERLAQREPDGSYFATLLDGAEEKFLENPRAAQEWLDQTYYKRLLSLGKTSGIELFASYAEAKADFYNLLTLLRIRSIHARSTNISAATAAELCESLMVVGGSLPTDFLAKLFFVSAEAIGKVLEDTKYRRVFTQGLAHYSYENDAALVEKEMDNYLTRMVAAKRYTALGPESLFGYLYARRIEVTNLRLALAVRLQGLPEASARERLRELYV